MSANSHHDSHSGQPAKQKLVMMLMSFLVPFGIIAALVSIYLSGSQVAYDSGNQEMAVARRIQKVGSVELAGAGGAGGEAKQAKTGEEVFKAQCTTCHTAGAAGAPKFGDAGAWGPRIKSGFEALVNSAMKGKGNMPAQGGGELSDIEVARGVAYMANAGGAKFAEPKAPAAK